MIFGKFKKKTIAEVTQRDKDYIPHLVSMGVHTTRPDFKLALEHAGMLKSSEQAGKVLALAKAKRVLEKPPASDDAHPELRRLR